MNKKVMLIPIIVVIATIIVMFIVWFCSRNYLIKDAKRIEEIRSEVKSEAEEYINILAPLENNKGKEVWLSDKELTDPSKRGASKDILLQYNKKDYCSAVIHGVSGDSKWNVDVYLKCNSKMLLKNLKYKYKEYDDTLEYYKCVTLTGGTDTMTYKDFTCPSDKKEYVLEKYAFYSYMQ